MSNRITNVQHDSVSLPIRNNVLGEVYFSREFFIETINQLEKQYNHDTKCSEAFRVILPNDFISNYNNHFITNQLVKVIKIAMNDNHKESWIEYFMYELEFGKHYKEGCATLKDGTNIDLSNAGSLWDFLNLA